MPELNIAELQDRGVVGIGGTDARTFLQGLITSDLDACAPNTAVFAGLLSPQGKILFDFLIIQRDGDFLFDVAKEQIPALIKRLTLYRLRADVTLDDLTETMRIYSVWGGDVSRITAAGIAASDPRNPKLGSRLLLNRDAPEIETVASAAYHQHRIALGVPEGGKDYPFNDTYPHEALYDAIHGVSFTKGCFVGQEVVSRMEHRGATKKRIVKVDGDALLPDPGTDISAGEISLGRLGSSNGSTGLALIRIDRLKDVARTNQPATADRVTLSFSKPDWAPFELL